MMNLTIVIVKNYFLMGVFSEIVSIFTRKKVPSMSLIIPAYNEGTRIGEAFGFTMHVKPRDEKAQDIKKNWDKNKKIGC